MWEFTCNESWTAGINDMRWFVQHNLFSVINTIAQILIDCTSEIENQMSEQIPAIDGAALICAVLEL